MTRVLIVDDQPAFRLQLRRLLERAGMDVIAEAGDVPEAEAQVRTLHPDLAVVDVMLPGISGLDGVPRLKATARDCESSWSAPITIRRTSFAMQPRERALRVSYKRMIWIWQLSIRGA